MCHLPSSEGPCSCAEVNDLRRGYCPALSSGRRVIRRVPVRGRQEGRGPRGGVRTEAEADGEAGSHDTGASRCRRRSGIGFSPGVSEGASPAHSVLQLCTRSGPTITGGKMQLGLQLSRTADTYTGTALDLCKAQEPHLLVHAPPSGQRPQCGRRKTTHT